MNKLYNNTEEITSNLQNFFKNLDFKINKQNLKKIIFAMKGIILGGSVTQENIVLHGFDNRNIESGCKRLNRLLTNEKIDYTELYEKFISQVLKNVKFKHKKITIVIDHTFTENNYATIVFTLKINKQCIPLFFKSSKTKEYCNTIEELLCREEIFTTEVIKSGISKVYSLLKDNIKDFNDYEVLFLADRWFDNTEIYKHIDNLGALYYFRIKLRANKDIKILDSKTSEYITKKLPDLKARKHSSKYFEKVIIGD